MAAAGDVSVVAQQPPAAPAPVNPLVDRLTAASSASERQAIFDANPSALSDDLIKALTAKGIDLRRQGRLDEAGRAFLASKEVADRRGDRLRAGNALINYSSIPAQQADFPAAFAAINEARSIADALHDNDMLASALGNLGIIDKLTGDFNGALETYQRALALARLSHNEETESRALNNLGNVQVIQGHYRDALDTFQQSLAIRERLGKAEDIALALNNIGTVYESQRNDELALEYYRRALALSESSGGDTSNALNNIANVYERAGRFPEALEMYRRLLARHESRGNRAGVATATYNIASLDRRQGKYADALEGFRASLAMREAISDRGGMAEALGDIAATLGQLERFDEALAAADRGRAVAADLKSNDRLWQPLTTIGDLHRALGQHADAERAYREAIGVIEALRDEVAGGSASRERFLESKLNAYTGLAVVLAAQARAREALAASEQARGRALADMLTAGQVAAGPLTPPEREQQSHLEQAVVSWTARAAALQRRGPSGGPAIAEAVERLRVARVDSGAFRDALDARYPVRRLARGSVSSQLLALAGDLLPDRHAAIVEYMVIEAATYVFVVTRGDAGDPDVQAFEVPVERTALATEVNRFRQKLAARALDFHTDARALYDLLLKPARAALAGRTRLVIIPDGVLWTIPFETLEPAAGRTVLDAAAVSYAPSIAVLGAMRERRAALESAGGLPRLLIAADPASDLPKLPDAQRQADALSALYGASRSRVFVGAAATEPRVRAAAAGATILHFATHGVVDGTNPMYSYLQLTRTGEVDAETDGRLEAWEVVSLKLDAIVAVLAACDTARGKLGGGEGVVGLAWAFFAAGTPATVVSLWQLESGSATTLTLGFHQRLRTGLLRGHGRVADSLRAAALELRRDPRYRHPFYWAGLVTIGDGY